MKICHITTVHGRYDTRIFIKECISLVNEGHQVYLIVNDDLEDEIINGVMIKSIRMPMKNKFSRVISNDLKKKVIKIAIDLSADIYQFHDPELLKVGKKLKKSGFKVIYDVHEDVPRQIKSKEWIPLFLRPIFSRVFEKYENKCSKKFDAIITATPYLKDRFDKINESVWTVFNFPSTKDICYSGENYSNRNPGCYIGGLTYTRGIVQIAEATSKANIKLNLCGPFQSKGLEKEILEKYTNIEYLGVLDRNNVSKVLVNSSLGFVTLLNTPNDYMAYPVKLFEYMAAGIPVISSNFPIYQSIVNENNCGICVDPLDVYEIKNAIERIVNDKNFADILRKNGYASIINKYNWESQVKILISCYKNIIQ